MKKCWECLDASPDALEGEAVVKEGRDIRGCTSVIEALNAPKVGMFGIGDLPAALIGKKVKYIIFESGG